MLYIYSGGNICIPIVAFCQIFHPNLGYCTGRAQKEEEKRGCLKSLAWRNKQLRAIKKILVPGCGKQGLENTTVSFSVKETGAIVGKDPLYRQWLNAVSFCFPNLKRETFTSK